MAFQAWTYILMFFSIVALNHRYGKSYEDTFAAKERRRARTQARMAKADAAEKEADEAARKKRREAREKRRKEQERMEGIKGKERVWVYGHHTR